MNQLSFMDERRVALPPPETPKRPGKRNTGRAAAFEAVVGPRIDPYGSGRPPSFLPESEGGEIRLDGGVQLGRLVLLAA